MCVDKLIYLKKYLMLYLPDKKGRSRVQSSQNIVTHSHQMTTKIICNLLRQLIVIYYTHNTLI